MTARQFRRSSIVKAEGNDRPTEVQLGTACVVVAITIDGPVTGVERHSWRQQESDCTADIDISAI